MKNAVRPGYLLLCCLLLMAFAVRPALAEGPTIGSLKVAYIYNIAKFTRWPDVTWARPTEPLHLCFYDPDGADSELQGLQKKKVNGHPIEVLKPEKEGDFKQCHVLYIDTKERHRYRYLLSLIDQQRVLVISDDSPFFDYGGLINLVEKEQRLRFEVNMQQLALSELKLSSKLLKLAILIDNPR